MSIHNLKNSVVSKHDVIVIGAGMGGLGAGCKLAISGKDVLVLEKHAVAGGFATSFVRGRFEFEGALHELNDVGNEQHPGRLWPFFKQLGILDDMEFVDVPEIYRAIYYGRDGNYDITLPFGVEHYFNTLKEVFPASKEQIERYKQTCIQIYQGMGAVGDGQNKINPIKIVLKHPWLARVAGLTHKEFMEKFFTDKKLMAVISQLWGYFGEPPGRCNALVSIGALFSYLIHGAAFAKGRSHAFTTAAVKAIERHGGKVLFNALVDHVIMENGKAKGVQLLNGQIFLADAVISNVNPVCFARKMMPPNSFSENYLRKILRPDIGPSAFSVYLGLNASPQELGLTCYEQFIQEGFDADLLCEESTIDNPKLMVAACYNLLDTNISPPGTSQLVLTTLQYGKDWMNIPPTEYFRIKDKTADKMIRMVEKTLCPSIREHIEVAEAATPITYYRYSKALEGAIYGTNNRVDNSPMFRLKTVTPIKNVFLCGAWTEVGGGFAPSFESGISAAENYLKSIGGK
jgi:prolycopene isomerase